jgi:hypothetical protein
MVRSELVALLGKENPELSAQEIEKIVDLFFEAVVDQLFDAAARGSHRAKSTQRLGRAGPGQAIGAFRARQGDAGAADRRGGWHDQGSALFRRCFLYRVGRSARCLKSLWSAGAL